MQLSSNLNDGLVEVLDNICGTDVTVYPYKKKVVHLNDALDWYKGIAQRNGYAWPFDDSNLTTPPIPTQNIVSGTGKYKMTGFSSEVVDLLKLEIDDGTGVAKTLYPETLESFGNYLGNLSGHVGGWTGASFDQLYVNASAGIPTKYVKLGDYIYLDRIPNYNATNGLKAYVNRPSSKFLFVSATVTIATPGVFSSTGHGLVAGDTVILNTDGALPTGLSVDTQYYVISAGLTSNAFELSATSGGSAINTSGSQSGNHSFLKTNGSPGINSQHHLSLARKAAATFMTFNNTSGVYNSRLSVVVPEIQKDERMIASFFANRDRDIPKRLQAKYQDNR